jgi:RNA polymerase sigma factor (sigma-70 family)
MCTGSFARKRGNEWSDDEITAALEGMYARVDAFVQFAYGFTRDLSLAQDVVQEKFIEAWHRRHTYDPTYYIGKKCPFCNWLYTMIARAANGLAQTAVRQRERLRHFREEAMRQQLPPRSQPPPAPGAAQDPRARLWELAQPYRGRFGPETWKAIELCWGRGLTLGEAAQETGKPKGTIKVACHRAGHILRNIDGDLL